MDVTKLNKELDDLLKQHPELLSLQARISFTLAMIDEPEVRAAVVFEEMMDHFDLMSHELNKLVIKLNRIKNELQLQ